METCIKGMSQEEIIMELAKDDMGKCATCDEFYYFNGTMGCRRLENGGN